MGDPHIVTPTLGDHHSHRRWALAYVIVEREGVSVIARR